MPPCVGQVVPANHFGQKLDELVPRECKANNWRSCMVEALGGVGNDGLSLVHFLGSAADGLTPDHSMLSAFKRCGLESGKLDFSI